MGAYFSYFDNFLTKGVILEPKYADCELIRRNALSLSITESGVIASNIPRSHSRLLAANVQAVQKNTVKKPETTMRQWVAHKRWMVMGMATYIALAGCQSVTMRAQNEAELLPFPEAGEALPGSNAGSLGRVNPPSRSKSAAVAPGSPTDASQIQSAEIEGIAPLDGYPMPSAGMVGTPMRGVPSELRKTSLPTYIVEPPDILLIDAVKLVPKPPYRIQSLDILQIIVVGTLQGQDIAGQFVVDPSGNVDLGPAYGKVNIGKQSIDEATKAIDKHLRQVLREPEVSVVLSQSSGMPQLAGEYLIAPDGTINLGTYGSVFVAGMTLAEVKDAVELQLSKVLRNPRVGVDVLAYNSKVFYIVSQGAGLGDGVARVPMTGNETVLDAIANVNGMSRLASKKIWIARPSPSGQKCDQILPVNWGEITAGGSTATNYQILAGDRLFIAEDKFIAMETVVTKVIAPFERIFGFGLLGAQVTVAYNNMPLGFQGSNFF
jgi:polysaccharide biosynthesis/export protein